jgi:hypothetical protein
MLFMDFHLEIANISSLYFPCNTSIPSDEVNKEYVVGTEIATIKTEL